MPACASTILSPTAGLEGSPMRPAFALLSRGIAHSWQNFLCKRNMSLSSNDFGLNDFAFSLRLSSFAALRLNSFWLRLRRAEFLLGFLALALRPYALAADQDWPTVGGDSGCSRYSPLTQINRRNVTHLQVAWTYHCGDQGQAATIECTPIVIGGVLYLTTGASLVVALDA